MKPCLLDVNVLIALAWPSHMHHLEAQEWFARNRSRGFRTCPLTQTGFVRISSNRKFTLDSVTPAAALLLLDRITTLPEHEFWPDDLPVRAALSTFRLISGPRQVADAYLLGLAASHGGVLATLDRGILALAGGDGDLTEILL